jgi:peroxiredoxin
MSLKQGDKAPDFKLFSSDLKEVSLSDYQGKKLVIHFFPMAFTGTCTTQLCTMRDSFGYYEGMNAGVVGISVDSPFTFPYYLISTRKLRKLTALFMRNLHSI